MMAVRKKPPAKRPAKPPAKKPPAKPAAKPPAPNPSAGTTPSGVATAGAGTDNATLDLAAMGSSSTGADATQVTTSGGPSGEDAVYSTGTGPAQQLNYRQTTTYQEMVAQQMGGAGPGTTTGPATGGGQ